jgi:hypothetical protein
MKIISFAWTTPALLAGSKCVTRREWDKKYAESFEAGEYVQAFDKSPRAGGKCVAIIELTQKPYLQGTDELVPDDWQNEGFAHLESIGAKCGESTARKIWDEWKLNPQILYVVRFKTIRFIQESE